MVANELRIGNWVKNDCNDEFFKVDGIDIITFQKDDTFLLPIELTNEILFNCGFKINLCEGEDFGDDNYYTLDLNYDTVCDLCFLSNDGILVELFPYGKWIKCNYLHQLQNIYFSLTGKELEISW